MADSFLTSPETFNSDFVVMAAYQAATGAPPTFAQFNAAVASLRAGTLTARGRDIRLPIFIRIFSTVRRARRIHPALRPV